jgi:hypothetical protein
VIDVSEELSKWKAATDEMLKAVRCLYIVVDEHVAKDVSAKVAAYVETTTVIIAKLHESVKFWQKDSATAWDKCEERRQQVAEACRLLGQYVSSERNYQSDDPPSVSEIKAFLAKVRL